MQLKEAGEAVIVMPTLKSTSETTWYNS